jgi:sugar lactone lactonase YvrE
VSPDGATTPVATTGGRPLGMELDAAGNLIVCDAVKGLLSVGRDGRVERLTGDAAGTPIGFADGLDIASDGRVYFSDASTRFGVSRALFDLLEARPHGRLLRYDPATRHTEVLKDGLYFANGVVLSPHEDYVLVNETYRYRITRYWLAGPKAGTTDVFADNLPGFPDGLSASSSGQGAFWVALVSVRNAIADRHLHPRPWAKRLLSKLPAWLWPKPQRYGLVVELDEQGRIVRSLHDPEGTRIPQVTSVREHGGALYLGSVDYPWLGRYRLPAATARTADPAAAPAEGTAR